MLVFNNQQRSGYDEIASYGPKFYPSIKEMDAIYHFAGWTLDLMAGDLEKLVAYQFIDYMDDKALTRFEAFLGIPYDESKTLEERRTLAYANWSSSGKMSKDKISGIVNTFAECDCTVQFTNSVLTINMIFKDDPTKYMNSIREILRKTIPAHIEILYKGKVDTNITIVWNNQVTIERIANRMTFYMHGTEGGIFLKGSRVLDGSMLLDKTNSIFPFVIGNVVELTHNERMLLCTGFTMYLINKPAIDQIVSLRIDVKSNEPISYGTSNKFGIQHSEKVISSIIVKNNLYYMDGNELLDGSRKLDAYIKREDL